MFTYYIEIALLFFFPFFFFSSFFFSFFFLLLFLRGGWGVRGASHVSVRAMLLPVLLAPKPLEAH